jgi:hypothetical protein
MFVLYLIILNLFLSDLLIIGINTLWKDKHILVEGKWKEFHNWYIAQIILLLLSIVLIPFCLFLLGQQFYLISVNMTTYEFLKPKRCAYLDYDHQTGKIRNRFNHGFLNNWKIFLCGTSKIHSAIPWEHNLKQKYT